MAGLENTGNLMRWFVGAAAAASVAVVSWLMGAVIKNQDAIAVLQAEIPLRTASRYTAQDAQRDNSRTDDQVKDLDRRLSRLENGNERR